MLDQILNPYADFQGVTVESTELVGHVLRRCHQVHNAIWADAVGGVLTSPQYSVLFSVVAAEGGPDQQSVGLAAGLDRTTVAGVIRRLEAQGWLRRERDPQDARRQVITMPVPAAVALDGLAPAVRAVQDRLLAPLDPRERDWLSDRLVEIADQAGQHRADADRRPGHLIRLAQQRHAALWAEELGGLITGPQFAVLRVLAADGPSGQGAVAERAALDRSSASDVLGRLEARGWTGRRPDPGDRRTRQVSLTEEGQALVASVRASVETVQERILEPVSPRDRERVIEVLAVVAGGRDAALAPRTGGQ